MNFLLTNMFNQAACLRLTETLLHFLWEGLLIGVSTACLAWLCRNCSARLRYGVHAGGLALLALSVPVTFLLMDGRTLPALRPVTLAPTIAVASSQTIASRIPIEPSERAETPFALAPHGNFDMEPAPPVSPVAGDFHGSVVERASRAVGEIEPVSLPARLSSSLELWLLRVSPYAVCIYLSGVFFMVGRLGLGMWGVRRLSRSARPVQAGRFADQIRRQAARIGLKIVPVVAFCERVTIPFVAGILRPVILLPDWLEAELEPAQLLVIVAHEMAHIRRLDLLVSLLQRLVETALFFHPAVWYVSRQLSSERENCCDDAVVRAGIEKVRYASILLRVAELCLAACEGNRPAPNASLAISGNNGSYLKRRILRLLGGGERGRSHSADSLALILLMALILGAIAATQSHFVAAAFETLAQTAPDSAPVADQTLAVAPQANASEAGSSAAPQSAESEITVRGVVLKPDGKPAAGAVVRAAAMADWSSWGLAVAKDLKSPLSETTADSQGMFSIRFPRNPFGDVSGFDENWRDIYKKTQIAASLTGYGPAWVTYGGIDTTQPLTLRLVEDLPLRGRVIDLEGRPIAGTSVKVSGPKAAKDEDLSNWIAGIKAGEALRTVHQKIPLSVESRLTGTPTAVTTDADGRFEIRGLGRERVVSLAFAGEQVAYREAQAATRDMETLQQISGFDWFEGKDQVFGATFTFSAEPTRTIEGIVKDAKTGELLSDVSVESKTMTSYPFGKYGVLKTITDKNGRFRLIGMPKGAENRLLFAPSEQQPYFQRDVDVPDPIGFGPVRMEIELHRGIWITGKVTDRATGAPVPTVRMLYFPFLTNEYARRTPEFHAQGHVDGEARQMRFQSKADGTYRIVGLPGRAIVGAESILKSYRHGVGYSDINGPKYQEGDRFDTYKNPMQPGPNWLNMMKEINPPADTGSVTLDFALDPGQSLRIHVQGPDGKPITGLEVHGISSRGNVEKTEDSELTVTNLGPDEERPLFFRHVEKRLGRVVRIGPAELKAGEVTVKLQPESYVVGRLLDEDGEPLSGTDVQTDGVPFAYATRLDAVGADADGRFRVVLIPGCRYSLQGEPHRREMYGFFIARDLAIEPGETKDLGTLQFGKTGKPIKR